MVKKWQELTVLIARCGSTGKRHARVLHGLGVTDLRACDPVLRQRESLREQVPSVRMYDSYETALTDRPDAVVICTPTAQHVAMATLAALHKRGSVLVGDVQPDARDLAGAFTPVPAGVGPLTVVMLMWNTIRAAGCRRGLRIRVQGR